MPITDDLLFQIDSLARVIYYVTDEDDRAILQIREALQTVGEESVMWVYNAAFGLKPVDKYVDDWQTGKHESSNGSSAPPGIHDALIDIYKADPREAVHVYVITDAERWMEDKHAVRRILNIEHQGNQNIQKVKILVFLGCRKVIPAPLARYVSVVQDKGPDSDDVLQVLAEACGHIKIDVPHGIEPSFRGLSLYEVKAAVSQSIVTTSRRDSEPSIDRELIARFRRQQFAKTDLVQYVDTSKYTFGMLGGLERFKSWAKKTRATWTPEGRAFGLKPPRGVLAVGVHGCGKSLAVKVLGNAWGVPVVQLELGRIRSNQVGESEANVYRVLRLIESASPCLVWVDEGEKSMSGVASSALSDAGVTARIIGILSTWLQETEAPVCMAITANTINTLPPEFINRLDKRFFFDMPSERDRVDILKIHIAKVGQDPDTYNLLSLAKLAVDMVGREIEQAIDEAMVDSYDKGKTGLDEDTLGDILRRKPRLSRTMQDEIDAILQWVGYDPEADDGVKAQFAGKPERFARGSR